MGRGPPAMLLEPGWFVIAESSWVGVRRVLPLRRFGLDLVLWRTDDGRLVLLRDRCPHRGARLSGGTVRGGCIECPLHAFRFDAEGDCETGSAEDDVSLLRATSFSVREAYGVVFAWLHPDPVTSELPWFDDLTGMSHRSRASSWSAHWSRVVARQLDAAADGPGWGVRLGGPVEMRANGASVRTWNSHDGPEGYLEWRAPNLMLRRWGARMCVLLAVVPVDRDRTDLIVRTYMRPVPVLGGVLLWLACLVHTRAVARDRSVVEGLPGDGSRGNGDVLVRADAPVAAFRRIREARQVGG